MSVTADRLHTLMEEPFDREAWPRFIIRRPYGPDFRTYQSGVAYFQAEADGTLKLMTADMRVQQVAQWQFDDMMREVSWSRVHVSPLTLAAFLAHIKDQ
jgi:hypothetical protein